MRFCELEIDLQTKMRNAKYKNNREIKNIINRTLLFADSNLEFKTELCKQISTTLDHIDKLIRDIYENNEIETTKPIKEN
jgi:hypothetical protein